MILAKNKTWPISSQSSTDVSSEPSPLRAKSDGDQFTGNSWEDSVASRVSFGHVTSEQPMNDQHSTEVMPKNDASNESNNIANTSPFKPITQEDFGLIPDSPKSKIISVQNITKTNIVKKTEDIPRKRSDIESDLEQEAQTAKKAQAKPIQTASKRSTNRLAKRP